MKVLASGGLNVPSMLELSEGTSARVMQHVCAKLFLKSAKVRFWHGADLSRISAMGLRSDFHAISLEDSG